MPTCRSAISWKPFITRSGCIPAWATCRPPRPSKLTARTETRTRPSYLLTICLTQRVHSKAHPAIVDIETWQATQSILNDATNHRTSREPISDTYTYYLRGLLHCPHCDCAFTNSVAKGGAVRYYECLFHAKRKTVCPVQRINADALHASPARDKAGCRPSYGHAPFDSAVWGLAKCQ